MPAHQEELFWSKVDKSSGPDACWPWTGARDPSGYGAVKWNNRKKGAHRIALELKVGRPLYPKMETCHRCKTRICCNPAHLYEGTRSQNTLDSIAGRKQRIRGGKPPTLYGSDNPRAKARGYIPEATILDIYHRAVSGERYSSIVKEYAYLGVSRQTVKDIKLGRTWKWLTGAH